MFLATHLVGFGSGGAAGSSIYVYEATPFAANASNYTFSNFNTGSAGSLLVLCVIANQAASSLSVSSVTVNGVAATINVQTYGNNGSSLALASAIASIVSPGGNQSVVIGFGSSASRGLCVNGYNVSGLSSSTPYHTATGSGNAVTSVSCSLNVPDSGVAIATTGSNITEAITLSGLSTDRNAALSGLGWATGSNQNLAAQTGRSISGAGSSGVRSIVAASWA